VEATQAGGTRQLIIDTALRLFQERGFDGTTMRAIADEAGLSVGNAYYWFASKDHLVQAFYDRSQVEHAEALHPLLADQPTFERRLHAALTSRIDTMQPYKAFAAAFFRTAADPSSPLSPFSKESEPARVASTALYAESMKGSSLRLPARLAEELPQLLWLYQMGVVLFWVHDTSAGSARTYALVDRTVPLVVKLINVARFRVLRSVLDDLLDLIRDLRS
jgi:AcrR family transcriptional regulator